MVCIVFFKQPDGAGMVKTHRFYIIREAPLPA